MKKIITSITLSIIFLTTLSGCSQGYIIDTSYMLEDVKKQNEEILAENMDKYSNAQNKEEEAKYAEEVGLRYMNLGKYSNSISYYEKVLEVDNIHFPALNNIAVMYERVGEIKKALEYEKRLYEANPLNLEVISDVIRLLVKNGQYDEARGVLETFALTDKGIEFVMFVSDQYEYIKTEKQKALK